MTSSAVADPIAALARRGVIGETDVAALRRDVFADGVVDREEAEAVFRLERACAERHEAWNTFYVDALTDYFVWRREPRGYIDESAADFLLDNIGHRGRLDGPTEFELLLNVVHWADSAPERLKDACIDAVRTSVADPAGAVYGRERRPGVIDPVDVEIVRRIVYARSLDGSITVTRREADMVVDLHDATREAENAETWPDLFAKVVACHLLFPRGVPALPDADTVRRREAWMAERRGFGALLGAVGKAVARGDIDFRGAWQELDPFGAAARRREAEREAAAEAEAARREGVDEAEAEWLVARLAADPRAVQRLPVRALLMFVRREARFIAPALEPVLDRAGI